MPRRKSVGMIREIGFDSRFNSSNVQKFINIVMERGKKSIARSIVYDAFDALASKLGGDEKRAYQTFEKALMQVRPSVEVKSRRVGGSNYQVPTEVRAERSLALALRWLVDYAKKRNAHKMSENLANEIVDASNQTGGAYKKKEDTHKMAEANKAFAHLRW